MCFAPSVVLSQVFGSFVIVSFASFEVDTIIVDTLYQVSLLLNTHTYP